MTKPRLILDDGEELEPLSKDVSILTGNGFTFNTDTILLAAFSMPKRGESCADFGTGCGAIPLIWCARSQPKIVYGIELQPVACRMAQRSVVRNNLGETIRIVPCDIRHLQEQKIVPRGLDRIVCNPPYQAAGAGIPSRCSSKQIAFHETACLFSDFAAAAAAFLRWGGRFFCCMRPERLCDTLFSLRQAGLEPKQIRFVQQRKGTAPSLFLLQAVRGGRPGMRVAPVLLMEKENRTMSAELHQIYGDYGQGREG